jgi:hypothetical protein
MALFRPARTFSNPQNSQSGFATPGAGAQTTGEPIIVADWNADPDVNWEPERAIKGRRTWGLPWLPRGEQQGTPPPLDPSQRRQRGEMPETAPLQPGVLSQVETPYYSRGAAAFVPQHGKVLTNPIGAGVVALQRPQSSYGPSAQYIDGAIWWTSQVIPTSINLQGLDDPDVLAAILGMQNVQAVVRTTG